MNILFFLMPKSEVAYLYDDFNLRQIIEKFDYHKYSAMPVIGRDGKYVGTVTEGDILRLLRKLELNLQTAEDIFVKDIPRRTDNATINISANMEDLISMAVIQNFIPVVDDDNIFIGMVTRKAIMEYLYAKSMMYED